MLGHEPKHQGSGVDGTLFNDDNAALFANSLTSNTNLILLRLRGNHFTDAGIKKLYKAGFDDENHHP